MTESDNSASPGAVESQVPVTAGALLAAAREAAGLSIDAVAQQLKLAPRQVRALEEAEYSQLPGRTFIRGFMRNYARLLHLDPEMVLGALPVGAAEGTLESPTLHPTAPTMGELPTTDHSKASWMPWAIILTFVAIVIAGGVYEWLRPAAGVRPAGGRDAPVAAERAAPAATAHEAPPTVPAPAPAPTERGATALQNPLAAPAPAAEPAAAVPAKAAASSAPPAAEQTLVLTFRDYSWTEVRDREGHVLMSRMNAGGTTQTLSGVPPLEVVIGNASDVGLSYKGQPVDLTPSMRQNVARLTLQ